MCIHDGKSTKWNIIIGVTSNLIKRIWEHKTNSVEGFTKKYGVHVLVWYEIHETMDSAIQREKALKKWRKNWKTELIDSFNPDWKYLYKTII